MCIAADGDVSQMYCVVCGTDRYITAVLMDRYCKEMFCFISHKKVRYIQIGNTISLPSPHTIAIQYKRTSCRLSKQTGVYKTKS
jgi:hypothetical protein